MDEDRYDLDWLDLLEKLAFTGWTEARLLMLVGSLAWAWGSRHCNVNSLISYFSERGKIGERFPEAGRKALKYLRFSRCIEFGWRIGTVNAWSSRSLCCIASRYSKIFTAFLFFPFLSILFFSPSFIGGARDARYVPAALEHPNPNLARTRSDASAKALRLRRTNSANGISSPSAK